MGGDAAAPGSPRSLLVALTRLTGHSLPRGPALRSGRVRFLNSGLFCFPSYWGERTVPSGLAAVITARSRSSTALFARAAGLERLRALKIAGALVALAGIR